MAAQGGSRRVITILLAMDVWSWLQNLLADSYWHWVERLSWLIAITLLPLGLVQLWFVWREQRRILAELSRKPDLRVGFFSVGGKLLDVAYVVTLWDANTHRSAPIELKISSHNVGTRSAHDALVSFIFPEGISIISARSGYPVVPDIAGNLRVWDKHPDVHPDVYNDHTVTLTAADSLKGGFGIRVTISMDDYPTTKHVLAVKFLGTSAGAPPNDTPETTGA